MIAWQKRQQTKAALIQSVTPANAGVQFVKFPGLALPSVGFRLGQSPACPELAEGPE
jgi:hypothetical protein